MTLLSQFFQFPGSSGKQLRFNPAVGWSLVVGQGIVGQPENGRFGYFESGRVGNWLETIFSLTHDCE